jgi:hypothetical protein
MGLAAHGRFDLPHSSRVLFFIESNSRFLHIHHWGYQSDLPASDEQFGPLHPTVPKRSQSNRAGAVPVQDIQISPVPERLDPKAICFPSARHRFWPIS